MTNLTTLTPDLASRFADLALGHVTREYPHKLDHVLDGDADALPPRVLHPVFHGSFDWHSCVHGYWLLARVRRRFPDLPQAGPIAALFDARLTAETIAGELAYLGRPSSGGFERPYGWAWLLKLAAELRAGGEATARWSAAVAPLAQAFAGRFLTWLPKATYPVRAGVHSNTALALRLASDYAEAAANGELAAAIRAKAWSWYGGDRDCQAWEPSGDDFLSSALVEAECLRRLLPAASFRAWFAGFLPRLASGEPATLFQPATVSDRTDGKIAHLDGLNLSRAWCWRGIARAHAEGDPVRAVAEAAAARHLEAGLPHVAGDYMGEHWLASFALLALDSAGE